MVKPTKRNAVQLPLFEASALLKIDPLLNPKLLKAITHHIDSGGKSMIRTAVFHPETIFKHLLEKAKPSSEVQSWDVDGVLFTVTPKRLYAFHQQLRCAKCAIEGLAFYVERHVNESQPLYLNLYGSDKNGSLTLITCDHVLPDSFGGRYHMDNFQTMCSPCNSRKANHMSNTEITRVLGDISKYAKDWLDKEFISALLRLHLAINKERDRNEANLLRVTFHKHLKGFSHATKAHQYETMRRDIEDVLLKYQRRSRIRKLKMWVKNIVSRTLGFFKISVDGNRV